MACKFSINNANIMLRRRRLRDVQIIMRLIKFPVTLVDLVYIEVNLRPSKALLREGFCLCVYNPVGLHPFEDVVMRCEQNDLPLRITPSPRFLKCLRTYFRNLSIDYRCKFIDNNSIWLLANNPRKPCTELLAIAQTAADKGIIASVITDAGMTEFHGVPTKTCLALEPLPAEVADEITGALPLY